MILNMIMYMIHVHGPVMFGGFGRFGGKSIGSGGSAHLKVACAGFLYALSLCLSDMYCLLRSSKYACTCCYTAGCMLRQPLL
jgi:hypothetical protein